MKKNLPITIIIIFFFQSSRSQYSADWGKYMNDPVTGANFAKDDETQQLAVDIKNAAANDEYVYVIARSQARTDEEAYCTSNVFHYGAEDVSLAKYDRCGNLQWTRFIGTDNDNLNDECGDFAVCLALDRNPVTDSTYIYVAGYSYTNYDPITCTTCTPCNASNSIQALACSGNACVFQKSKKSEIDAFVAKYDESGKLIKWTYFGGDGDDYIIGIEVFSHNVFITGTTTSNPDFIPASTPKFDSTLSTSSDAFVAQLDGELCSLKFFSYIGGPLYERTHAIRCFKTQDTPPQIAFFLSGATEGDLADASYNPLNSYCGGSDDAFLSLWKFNKPTKTFVPQWLRYIGGKSNDRDREMIIDKKKQTAILTGFTQSKNYITGTSWMYPPSNFYDTSYNGIQDAFLAKVDAAGNPLWGTYLGGSDRDGARGLTRYTLNSGSQVSYIVVAGGTKSADMPQQPLHPAFENTLNGGFHPTNRDAFVAILTDPASANQVQQLEFFSYFGGQKDEWGNATIDYGPDLDLGGNKEIYLTFYTISTNIEDCISSSDYHHNTNTGDDDDGFLAKILNSNIPHQFDCSTFGWGINSPQKMEPVQMQPGSIILYPNPTINQLIVEAGATELFYRILTMTGVELYSEKLQLDNQAASIDISALPAGLYLFECEMNGQSYFQKIVVMK